MANYREFPPNLYQTRQYPIKRSNNRELSVAELTFCSILPKYIGSSFARHRKVTLTSCEKMAATFAPRAN